MARSELDGKRVVVALGGNALGDTPKEQLKQLERASKNLAHMVKEGINVVITHGNGPQVGIIDEAFVQASKDPANQVPFMPLADCNAMSQGYIGAQLTCQLMNEFRTQDVMRSVVDIPTHVVVDANDPAFKDLEKPIGAFMTEKDAKVFAKATGCQVKEDAGRGWRRAGLHEGRCLSGSGCHHRQRLGERHSGLEDACRCLDHPHGGGAGVC